MARPCGEIRAALAQALRELGSGGAGVTVRRLAAAAQVGHTAARRTVENMARAGQVKSVGREKLAGATHWETMYALNEPDDEAEPAGGLDALVGVMREFPACTAT